MECKDSYFSTYKSDLEVLIETYWNVKLCHGIVVIHVVNVLIERYWNVKVEDNKMIVWSMSVLIETYWNVKEVGRVGFEPTNQY